jgi:hypothetical protein
MQMLITLVASLSFVLLAVHSSPAQPPQADKTPQTGKLPATKPEPGKDVLPLPQELPAPMVVPFYIVPGPELGKRNVWELYSVNSRGQFVPRVVTSPAPVYYYYPTPSRQPPLPAPPAFMPYAVD